MQWSDVVLHSKEGVKQGNHLTIDGYYRLIALF